MQSSTFMALDNRTARALYNCATYDNSPIAELPFERLRHQVQQYNTVVGIGPVDLRVVLSRSAIYPGCRLVKISSGGLPIDLTVCWRNYGRGYRLRYTTVNVIDPERDTGRFLDCLRTYLDETLWPRVSVLAGGTLLISLDERLKQNHHAR